MLDITFQGQAPEVTEPYIAKLDEMIACQPHAIVSKIIANKPTGTVTMFAFDEGQSISEQAVPFDSVLFVTSGEMEIHLEDGEIQRVGEEMMIHLPAGTRHSIRAPRPFKMFSILIRADES